MDHFDNTDQVCGNCRHRIILDKETDACPIIIFQCGHKPVRGQSGCINYVIAWETCDAWERDAI